MTLVISIAATIILAGIMLFIGLRVVFSNRYLKYKEQYDDQIFRDIATRKGMSLPTIAGKQYSGSVWPAGKHRLVVVVGAREDKVSSDNDGPPNFLAMGDTFAVSRLYEFCQDELIWDVSIYTDSEDIPEKDLRQPLLLIGGPLANRYTKQVLQDRDTVAFTVTEDKNRLQYRDPETRKPQEYESTHYTPGTYLHEDYAYVAKLPNTWNPSSFMMIAAGCLQWGTFAGIFMLTCPRTLNAFERELGKDGHFELVCKSTFGRKSALLTAIDVVAGTHLRSYHYERTVSEIEKLDIVPDYSLRQGLAEQAHASC